MYLPVIKGNTIFASGIMKTQFLNNLILLFSYSCIHSVSFWLVYDRYFKSCQLYKIVKEYSLLPRTTSSRSPQPRSLHSVPQREKSGLTRFPANESPRRTGSRSYLSAKSSFYLPAFEIFMSYRLCTQELSRWLIKWPLDIRHKT